MNILYVTGINQPIEAVLKGEEDIRGLPAFYYPWKMLVDRGHTVDFVMTSNFNDEYNIKVDWFSEKNIIKNIYAPHKNPGPFRIFRKVWRFIQLLYYTNKAVKQKHYDFIYCKAFEGVAGQIIANIYHIRHGVRSFGDHMYLDIKKYGAKKAALKHPLEYLCYRLDCDFFLMTKDHKEQIITFESWKNKNNNYPFYLWPHGVEFKNINNLKCDIEIPNEPYIYLASRIDPIKRHDKVIDVLNCIHKYRNDVHVYFSGIVYSKDYKEQILKLIKNYKLEDYVHFTGPVSQDSVRVLAYNAIANVIMIDTGAVNNVFSEIFSTGAVIITLDDGGSDDFISNGKSGFIVKDEKEAADIVIKLINDKNLRDNIKKQAKIEAKEKIMTIEERFGKEVDLIESVAKEVNNSS